MIKRCPCCHAQIKRATSCSRCGADLNKVLKVDQFSRHYLLKAVQFLLNDEIEQSCRAINQSLQLKKTQLALVFRLFLIEQQSQFVLDLLANSQPFQAKQRLYHLQTLIPYSKKLQQLDAFSNYLLFKEPLIKSDYF